MYLSNQWWERWEKRDHCDETLRPLDESKQRSSIGNTVSRTGIFSPSFFRISLILVLYFEKGVCTQFIVISPVPGTHEWERERERKRYLTSLGYLPTRGNRIYLACILIREKVNKTRCVEKEKRRGTSWICACRRLLGEETSLWLKLLFANDKMRRRESQEKERRRRTDGNYLIQSTVTRFYNLHVSNQIYKYVYKYVSLSMFLQPFHLVTRICLHHS